MTDKVSLGDHAVLAKPARTSEPPGAFRDMCSLDSPIHTELESSRWARPVNPYLKSKPKKKKEADGRWAEKTVPRVTLMCTQVWEALHWMLQKSNKHEPRTGFSFLPCLLPVALGYVEALLVHRPEAPQGLQHPLPWL